MHKPHPPFLYYQNFDHGYFWFENAIGNADKHLSHLLGRMKFGEEMVVPTFSLIFVLANMTCMEAGGQPTCVQILPESYIVPNVGLNFIVNISIQNVNNLYGWEFKLYYPSDILNGTTVTEGPFLKTGNEPTFFRVLEFTDTYNNAYGRVIVSCSRLKQDTPGVSGDGVLATIVFTSKSTNGPKILRLEDVKLSDPNANVIPCITANGEVTVIPELPATLIPLILTVSTLLAVAYRKITEPKKFGRPFSRA